MGKFNRDSVVIAVIMVIVGLYTGLSEVLFTLYLDHLKITLPIMGTMVSVFGLIGFFVTTFIGVHVDRWRRKIVYSVGVLLNSLSSFAISVLKGVWELTAVKIADNVGYRLRMTVQPTLIFELFRSTYAKTYARVQGMELIFSGFGFLIAGSLVLGLGFQVSFICIGLIISCTILLLQLIREPMRPKVARRRVLEAYRFDIGRELKIICVFNLLHNLGFAICHTTFIYTLFFLRKFMLDLQFLSVILSIHHFTFGLPLLMASKIYARKNINYKKMFMIGNVFIGLPNILATMAPHAIPAAAIWFLHDIIGASISIPAQHTLTQIYARDDQRARDVNMALLFGSIGVIVGPAIGGFLADMNINLPFIVGGAIITASTIILAPLKYP